MRRPSYAKNDLKSISICSIEKVMFTGNQATNNILNQQTNANDLVKSKVYTKWGKGVVTFKLF